MIRMQQEFENIIYLVGNEDILMKMEDTPALPIFSDKIVEFLINLSNELLHDNQAKKFGDIIAYAFWIRRASIESTYRKYAGEKSRIGRGMAFQVAPSNIPVQFAVSMTYALIAGNTSVIRVSRKIYQQVDIICSAINRVIREKCPELMPYICIMRYEHNDLITRWLSERCDIRMIWGGDNTINLIRQIPVQPRCIELGFADRYSLAVIDSDDYMKANYKVVADDFYNDTYYTDQNACSSTRLIIWTGDQIKKAKEVFWETLEVDVREKYKINDIVGSEKLLRTAVCASRHPGIKEIRKNNAIVRVELPQLYDDIMDYKGNCGYFFEYETNDLERVIPLLKKECQTITYYGKNMGDRLRSLVALYGVKGVDRIVPIGHSMDLSFVWDGYDLPIVLSRIVSNV